MSPSGAPVALTGLGVVSPFGDSVGAIASHFATGVTAEQAGSLQVADVSMTAVPQDKRSRIGRLDRLCRFLLSASYGAVASAGLDVGACAERVGLSFGTGFGCLLTDAEYNQRVVEQGPAAASPRLFAYTVSSAAAGEVSIALGIKGPNVTAHMGWAAGLGAVGYGVDLIQLGKADVVLAGGADVIGAALTDGLRDMGLLKNEGGAPFQDRRPGIIASEGAGVVVLERSSEGSPGGWGRIDGYAAGFEPTLTRREPRSTGLSATMRRALAMSGHTADEVGLVLCSAHGTPVDAVERAALAEVFGATRPSPLLLAPKAVFGEAFAGSGVLALALAAGLLREAGSIQDGRAFNLDGSAAVPDALPQRVRNASVVMINALCYSGNIVSLVMSRAE